MVDSQPFPQILSPCNSGRRSSSSSCGVKSPEFEFWMLRNPINLPPPNLLSADELFSGGFVLPLHLLNLSNPPPPPENGSDRVSDPDPDPEPSSIANESASASKRWMHMFSRGDKKQLDSTIGSGGDTERSSKEKDSIRKREKRINGTAASAELNINIWPFARSRSAGNGGNRPRPAAATNRKVSSAPCSRSNSTGDSKSRKWPNSPSRGGGVHLGRSSPVWQVRRGGGRGSEAVARNVGRKDGGEGRRKTAVGRGSGSSKGRVLSLNVPMCIGYRNNLSCKSEDNSAVSNAAAAAGGRDAGESGRSRSNLFNLRSLFTKKVY